MKKSNPAIDYAPGRDLRISRKRRRNKVLAGYMFILPAFVILFMITVYPVLRTIVLSVSTYDFSTRATSWAGFSNFERIINDPIFWNSLKITIEFTVGSVLLHGIIAWVLALLLYRPHGNGSFTDVIRGMWILPWLFSNAAAALMWGLLYHPFGIINFLLVNSGLIPQPIDFIGDPRTALIALINVNVWKTYPIYLVLLLGALQAIPDDLHEAARVEGAGYFAELRHVTFPLVLPTVLTMTILDFITTFGHFDLVKMMTGGGPMRRTETLSFYIYREAFKSVDFPSAAGVSVIMFIILALCSVLYIRAYTRSSQTQ